LLLWQLSLWLRQYDEYIASVDIRTEFVDNKSNHQRVIYKFRPFVFEGIDTIEIKGSSLMPQRVGEAPRTGSSSSSGGGGSGICFQSGAADVASQGAGHGSSNSSNNASSAHGYVNCMHSSSSRHWEMIALSWYCLLELLPVTCCCWLSTHHFLMPAVDCWFTFPVVGVHRPLSGACCCSWLFDVSPS
jgi:hypothetical protein